LKKFNLLWLNPAPPETLSLDVAREQPNNICIADDVPASSSSPAS